MDCILKAQAPFAIGTCLEKRPEDYEKVAKYSATDCQLLAEHVYQLNYKAGDASLSEITKAGIANRCATSCTKKRYECILNAIPVGLDAAQRSHF